MRTQTIATSCAYCGDHSILDGPLSHSVCPSCERLMSRAAEKDADDRDLILMAVSQFGIERARADRCMDEASTDRADRAYRRVIRLLDKAMEGR